MRLIDADALIRRCMNGIDNEFIEIVNEIPEIDTKPLIHCKDCKYFEYDSMANVDGIPLIVAHEICKRWGDGCKTKEDGYCFLGERRNCERYI